MFSVQSASPPFEMLIYIDCLRRSRAVENQTKKMQVRGMV
jgi:hypothetical protein